MARNPLETLKEFFGFGPPTTADIVFIDKDRHPLFLHVKINLASGGLLTGYLVPDATLDQLLLAHEIVRAAASQMDNEEKTAAL